MWGRRRRQWLRRLPIFLAVMGPGIVSACAGNDAGGIATYAQAGALYGTRLLWLLFAITFVLAIVQEMCARMGAVTQKGLAELIREQFGVEWTFFALAVMFVANVTVTAAEFAGIASACEVFGASKFIVLPASAILLWGLVVEGSFRRIERIFLVLTLVYATYLGAGYLAVRNGEAGLTWGTIMRELVTPHLQGDRQFLLLSIAVVGTTITPWMQFFLQSTLVDKGVKIAQYRYERIDVIFGAFVTDLIAFFIIVATAATLYQGDGVRSIATAGEAAHALRPVAGGYAEFLFATGLLSASLLASAVLPLTTSYAFCEAFGWEMGLSRTWREAPVFYGIYSVGLLIGLVAALMPGLPLLKVMLFSQDVNGILLPVVLIFILKLVNNRRVMGTHVNSRLQNAIAGATVVFLIALTGALLVAGGE